MPNPKAQVAKEKGNDAFKAGDYPTAIGYYTSAILADRADATYPLNRAAAYLKLGKAEDAERDCNTVLELNSKNVKALFRRGQARVGMNKLLEAHKDFSDIMVVEPSNTAAREELKKVVDMIQTEKAKKAKSPVNVMSSSLETHVATKRRRVAIKIIDPNQPAASSSSTLPEQKAPAEVDAASAASHAATATNKKPHTLEAISSRPLKPETPPVPPALSAAAAALKTDPGATPASKSSSFKDAKQVRETAKPSRVGGGIFRASGKNTIFAMKEDGAATFEAESAVLANREPSVAAQSQAPVNKARESSSTPTLVKPALAAPALIMEAPATLFDFNKAWNNARSTEEKWQLMNTISPTQFPGFCKSSMEAELFSSILSMFADVLSDSDDGIKGTVLAYMENFPKIARFNTVVLFFSRAEKAVVKTVWELLGVEKPIGAWAPIAQTQTPVMSATKSNSLTT